MLEGIYDVPPTSHNKSTKSNYDFPPSDNTTSSIYDVPASHMSSGASHDLYDVPRGFPQQTHCREHNRNKGVYDIPPSDSRSLGSHDVTDGMNRLSFSSTGSSMSTSSSSTGSPAEGRLILDLDSALQKLARLQQGLESSVSSLLNLAFLPNWRTHSFMERHANEVRTTMERVRSTLTDLLTFGKGAAANATALSDPALHLKLKKQLQRLEDSQQILHLSLENGCWVLTGSRQQGKSDELERFMMVARTLPDDAKQQVSTIRGNAELLFQKPPIEGVVHPFTCTPTEEDRYVGKTKPFPVVQDSEQCVKSWMEDYDYVHLQVRPC